MAILGVLLGITMTVLAAAIAYGWHIAKRHECLTADLNTEIKMRDTRLLILAERMTVLEGRKAQPINALNNSPEAVKARAKLRTWSEDVEAVNS